MYFADQVATLIVDSLNSRGYNNHGLSHQEARELLEIPKEEHLGDLAFPCFALAKKMRMNPRLISEQLTEDLSSNPLFAKVAASGPYLNFFFNIQKVAESFLPEVLSQRFLSPYPETGERVMIEFSQPNTHKEFHVGHLRNASLGDAMVRLNRWLGHKVVAANYFGDEGTHIAKCLWYLRSNGNPKPTGNRAEFLGKHYVAAVEALDFKRLSRIPLLGVVSAEVLEIKFHPHNSEWKVVQLSLGASQCQVVCGGRGYEKGSIVAYAKPGTRLAGREVHSVVKEGVESQGFVCSEAELGVSADNEKIFLLPAGTALGEEICNLTRIAHWPHEKDVSEIIRERQKGVDEVQKAIESGKGPVYDQWRETRQWSLDEFSAIYQWLGISFDHLFYESEVGESGKEMVDHYLKKGLLIRSEGAVGIDLSAYNLPFFMLLKSTGAGLYSTKDLSLAIKKFEEFQIDRSIYVVDIRQSLHFQQLFKTLELMGFPQAARCVHLSYAFVEGAHGEMSSRAGTAISFSTLKKTLVEKVRAEFLDHYLGEWPIEEIEEAARKIAVATIRYGMLNQDSQKNIVFDLGEWTSRTGNTGPYLLYSYARIHSIMREAAGFSEPPQWETLHEASERSLLLKLCRFREVVFRAGERTQPQLLCIYLYDLCKEFNRMYAACPVLKAESVGLKAARLKLLEATSQVLKSGLALLGIATLERM